MTDLDALSVVQQTTDYLYKIEGPVSPEAAVAIGLLRQLINEEFAAKGHLVSSQLIFDMLRPVLTIDATSLPSMQDEPDEPSRGLVPGIRNELRREIRRELEGRG